MEMTNKFQELSVDAKSKSKSVTQRVTRTKAVQLKQDKGLNNIADKEEYNNYKNFQEFSQQSEIILKESFYGIYNIIRKNNIDIDQPILIIIKNIKTFPHNILNDLIHQFKKYRAAPYNMKLNLVLGV